jgi:predicted ABC-type ATPase
MIFPPEGRPIIVVIAGPNGAGKSTFFQSHLARTGFRFVNADDIAREMGSPPYEAARLAEAFRNRLVEQRESFIFETVLSDPVGAKVAFLERAAASGYNVVVCFVGIPSPEASEERVAMRASQGGHDVPTGKLTSRYPRVLANLKIAIETLPLVMVYDNSDLSSPFQKVAAFQGGKAVFLSEPIPAWLRSALPGGL